MALTKAQRDALPTHHFAVPGKRELPIHDETHTRLAWDMVSRTKDLSPSERNTARERIKRRAKELGIDTKAWNVHVAASAMLLHMEAMSIDLPVVEDHPNRMPFKGVLTFVDTPSDMAVGGAGGKRTYLPRLVAEAALPSLMGMPIDFTPKFDGHDKKRKIGTISAATLEGDAIHIEGFFFAADFPEECEHIRANKDQLGFSYEIQAQTLPMGDLLQIIAGTFTGAAVLRKDKAAYQKTSLAAQAEQEIPDMTEDEFKALLAAGLKPVSDALAAINADVVKLKASGASLEANAAMRERVAPHSLALRNCAAGMEAAGIGVGGNGGHVQALHHMASSMDAEAASGRLPSIYRDYMLSHSAAKTPEELAAAAAALVPAPKLEDSEAFKKLMASVADVTTIVTDLKTKAFNASAEPARKTLPAELMTLLAKGGINEVPKDGITEAQLDNIFEKAGIPSGSKTIALKQQFSAAGQLARRSA